MEGAGSSSTGDKKWVKFDENGDETKINGIEASSAQAPNYNGAVIDTETVQVDFEKVKQLAQKSAMESQPPAASQVMRNVNLDEVAREERVVVDTNVQRGFGNCNQINAIEYY